MIIKNNFNDKDASPLKDYQGIGKGSNSIDKKIQEEQEGFIKENIENNVIQDIINNDYEYEDDDKKEDKWNFFR